MKALLLILCASSLFAGQSLRLNGTQTASNGSVAAQGANSPCRVEFQMVFTSSPTAGHPADGGACGLDFQFVSSTFQIAFNRMTGASYQPAATSLFASNWVLARIQLIPSGAGGTWTQEFWDINGALVFTSSQVYTGTSGSNSPGAQVGSTGTQDSSWGFFRISTTTVAVGSTPPLFSGSGNLLDWEFNGNLNDSSGNGYTATSSAGAPANPCGSAPCYATTTPPSPLVISNPITLNAPSWLTWQSLKTGVSNTLDCSTRSYSQADSPGVLTYSWAQTSGASAAPSSLTAAQPTVTPPSDGGYAYTCQVTDGVGNMSNVVTLTLGSVSQDSNGVVTNLSANATKVFGPMIAFGKNPWQWMDERAFSDVALQTTYLTNSAYNPPEFTTRGAGTIAYKYGGNLGCTTLNGGITATATSITVVSAACLDLSTLPTTPTDILIETELVRICSVSGNVLTVCYDGRGAARASYGMGTTPTQVAATSHSSGAAVGDEIATGTSTKFITDSSRPMCPGGAPGFPGPVQYSTGTVTMTASSTTLTGSGTTWNVGNHVFPGQMVRISATHGGGTAFIFLATATAVGSTTSLTMSRPAPSDIDATAFSYQIIGANDSSGTGFYYGDFSILIPTTSSTTNIVENVYLCESETRLFSDRWVEAGAMNLTSQTGQTYSWKTTAGGAGGAFGVNFYGSGLAQRAFYTRSGYASSLTLANNVDDNWINDPEIAACFAQGGGGGYQVMGGIIGGMVDKVLNGSTPLSWDHLRNCGDTASSLFTGANQTNCNIDSRTLGTGLSILSLLALFDTTDQAHWNALLYSNTDSAYAWLVLCKDAVQTNSWANLANTFNASSGPTITATNGSESITATSGTFTNGGTSPGSCTGGASSGTATVTAGSDAMTAASGLVASGGSQIVIDGTRLGQPYTMITDYQNNSAASNTLGALWPSDATSGTVNWSLVTSPWYTTAFGTSNSDNTTTLQSFVCTYVDSTHATLNRAWPFTTGSYHMFTYNVSGTVQQPFLLSGIFSDGLTWGSQNSNSTIASAFNTLLQDATSWMYTTGVDPQSKGLFYARINKLYEPPLTWSTNYAATFIDSTMQAGSNTAQMGAAFRQLTGEAMNTLRTYYAEQGNSSAAKTWGDGLYGALWGRDGYNTGGVYVDSASVGNNIGASNLTDVNLSGTKWSGFFFGMGMAHQWPAIRTQLPTSVGSGVAGPITIKGPVNKF